MADNGFNRLAEIFRDPTLTKDYKKYLISHEVVTERIRHEDIEMYWQLYFEDETRPYCWWQRVSVMAGAYTDRTKPTSLAECAARAMFRDESVVDRVIHDVNYNSDILIHAAAHWSHYMRGYIPIATQAQFHEAIAMREDIETKRTLVNAKKTYERQCELQAWNAMQ